MEIRLLPQFDSHIAEWASVVVRCLRSLLYPPVSKPPTDQCRIECPWYLAELKVKSALFKSRTAKSARSWPRKEEPRKAMDTWNYIWTSYFNQEEHSSKKVFFNNTVHAPGKHKDSPLNHIPIDLCPFQQWLHFNELSDYVIHHPTDVWNVCCGWKLNVNTFRLLLVTGDPRR